MDKKEIINRLQNYIDISKKRFPITLNRLSKTRFNHKNEFPSWCYCPTYLTRDITIHKEHADTCGNCYNVDIDVITALYTWRVTKGIYLFNDTLTKDLQKTKKIEDLPIDILFQLPHWCDYITFEEEIPLAEIYDETYDGSLRGFFIYLDYDIKTKIKNLMIVLDVEAGKVDLISLLVNLSEDNNLIKAIEKGFDDERTKNQEYFVDDFEEEVLEDKKKSYKSLCKIIDYILPYILYICSDKQDITLRKTIIKKGKCKKRKNALYNTSTEPDFWEVGLNYKKKIVQYEQSNNHTGGKMHPHVRSAHWHMYYAGPRSAENREVRIKWIPNILVNSNSESDIKPTIFKT